MIPIIDKKKTGIHLRKIMDAHSLSVKDVQQYLGLGSVQSVYHWLNGISLPSLDNLYALSEVLQVSMDSLICGNRKYAEDRIYDAQLMRLITYYKKMHAA